MATYRVRWSKSYYASGVVEIETDSAELAEAMTRDAMGDYDGSMQYDPDGDSVDAWEIAPHGKEGN